MLCLIPAPHVHVLAGPCFRLENLFILHLNTPYIRCFIAVPTAFSMTSNTVWLLYIRVLTVLIVSLTCYFTTLCCMSISSHSCKVQCRSTTITFQYKSIIRNTTFLYYYKYDVSLCNTTIVIYYSSCTVGALLYLQHLVQSLAALSGSNSRKWILISSQLPQF